MGWMNFIVNLVQALAWVAVTEKHRGPALLAEHRKVCPNKAGTGGPTSA